MPTSKKPRKKGKRVTGRWSQTSLYIDLDGLKELRQILIRIEIITEMKLHKAECTIDDVQLIRDVLNFASMLVYAGHNIDEKAFEAEHGAEWMRVQDGFHTFYGKACHDNCFTCTATELEAIRTGVEIACLIIEAELDTEPAWCIKVFRYMKIITDAEPGRIKVDMTDIEKQIKKFDMNRDLRRR